MALETSTFISDLVVTNPTDADQKAQGAAHLRQIKAALKTTLPGVTGAVTATHTELNFVAGVTSGLQAQINLKAPSASPVFTVAATLPSATTIGPVTAAQIGALGGVTPAQIGALSAVTGDIQAQFNAEISARQTNDNLEISARQAADALLAPLASPAFTGTPTAPTAAVGTGTTQIASTAFVTSTAFASALPGQTGNAGKFVTTDGTNASWALVSNIAQFFLYK